jgi:hypothetical protein
MSKQNIIKGIDSLGHRHDAWRVFGDFVEMSAISISNACDMFRSDVGQREARYLEIAGAYKPDELKTFSELLGQLIEAFEKQPGDVLGEVFMEMDLGSKWKGQFFTPYSLCKACATPLIEGLGDRIAERGFVTVNEPATGGGAMLIAFAEAMRDNGYNYQTQMHCTAQDLDLKAVHMSYIQLSLLGIPAVVIHGNTLQNEKRSVWYTPMHIMGGWTFKLRSKERPLKVMESQAPACPTTYAQATQVSLF